MILGKCHHCRKSIYYLVDFLRGSHDKCNEKHEAGIRKIEKMVRHTTEFGGSLPKLKTEIQNTARSSYITPNNIAEHVFKGWESAAKNMLQNSLPSELEEKNMHTMLNHFAMPREKVNSSESYRNLQHLPFLRDVSAGLYPSIQATENDFRFILHSSEAMVKIFANVDYYEEVTHTEIEYDTDSSGSYQDRVRTVGRQINRTNIERIDSGVMGLSTMHIYFAGDRRRFRIPYHRIVVLNRESIRVLGIKTDQEMINLTQDGRQAIPQQFRLKDTWFAYNLLVILSQK